MKIQLRNVVALLLLLATAPASAQKVITFESKDSKLGHNKAFKHGEGKNSLTVGMLSWFNGYVPVYYERSVLSMLSVQIGAGATCRSFGSDLGFVMAAEGETSSTYTSGNDIKDDYSHYKFRSTTPGLYLSFAPKVYYHDEGMDGEYVSPMLEYKMFSYKARKADVTAPMSGGYNDDRDVPHSKEEQMEYMRCLDFTVNFGGHYQSRNHVTFGWSTGFGVRTANSQRLDIGTSTDGVGNSHYTNAVEEYKKTKLLFTFNFVVGRWF
jgi:hypothetical protein